MKVRIAFLLSLMSLSLHVNAMEETLQSSFDKKYNIDLNGTSPKAIESAVPVIEDAIREFDSKIGPLKNVIKISIATPGCLRVGYNFELKQIQFCDLKSIVNFGLSDRDVIRHELFHAMVCDVRPDVCVTSMVNPTDITATHEALADFFAYSFEPKEFFGEKFYSNQPFIRSYHSDLCYSLVDSPHEKGNALSSQLISAGLTLKEIKSVIFQSNFNAQFVLEKAGLAIGDCFVESRFPKLDYVATNYSQSRLNKYWINGSDSLLLKFTANEAMIKSYPNFVIKWVMKNGQSSAIFNINSEAPLNYSITPNAKAGIEKVFVQILDGDTIIGSIPFYLGIK